MGLLERRERRNRIVEVMNIPVKNVARSGYAFWERYLAVFDFCFVLLVGVGGG